MGIVNRSGGNRAYNFTETRFCTLNNFRTKSVNHDIESMEKKSCSPILCMVYVLDFNFISYPSGNTSDFGLICDSYMAFNWSLEPVAGTLRYITGLIPDKHGPVKVEKCCVTGNSVLH